MTRAHVTGVGRATKMTGTEQPLGCQASTVKVLRLSQNTDLAAVPVQHAALNTLENGGVVVLLGCGFSLTAHERGMISSSLPIVSAATDESLPHRTPTVVYEPSRRRIMSCPYAGTPWRRSGIKREFRAPLAAMMARFGTWAESLVAELFPNYSSALARDRITYKVHAREAGEPLHIDSSFDRRARGRGTFRVFCNIDPAERAAMWHVGEPFEPFVRRFIPSIRLSDLAWTDSLLARLTKRARSPYDELIAELRRLGQGDDEYQRAAPRECLRFPSGSTWLAFTDLVPHAAFAGHHRIDETFFLPAISMANPSRSSLFILERLTGRQLA